MTNLKYYRLDRKNITEEQFEQIVAVESEDGYTEDQLRRIWFEDEKDDNFVCVDGDKIIAHISYNPQSKRRNGSLYMINLSVLPEYRRKGIAMGLINTATEYYMSQDQTLPMSLSVDKDNIPALRLYQKVGFEIKDPVCEVDEDDEPYIMESNLLNIRETIRKISRQLEEKY